MSRLVRRNARRILNSSLYAEDIKLCKEIPGERNQYGEYEAGRIKEFELKASVEPIDPESQSKYRDILTEGNRSVDARFFYICTVDPDFLKHLRTGQFKQTKRDVIIYNDERYLVRRIADYSQHGHIEVLATREEGQDG